MKDCEDRLMSEFIGGEDVRMGWNGDLGPLAAVERGFKAREGIHFVVG